MYLVAALFLSLCALSTVGCGGAPRRSLSTDVVAANVLGGRRETPAPPSIR